MRKCSSRYPRLPSKSTAAHKLSRLRSNPSSKLISWEGLTLRPRIKPKSSNHSRLSKHRTTTQTSSFSSCFRVPFYLKARHRQRKFLLSSQGLLRCQQVEEGFLLRNLIRLMECSNLRSVIKMPIKSRIAVAAMSALT